MMKNTSILFFSRSNCPVLGHMSSRLRWMRASLVEAALRLQASLTAPSERVLHDGHMLFLPGRCASLLHGVKLRKSSSSLHVEPARLAAASAAVMSMSSTMSYSFLPDALLSVGLGRFLNINARASFACLPSTFMIQRSAWSELCLHRALLQWSPPWPHLPLSSWHSNTAVSPRMTSSASTCAHGSGRFSSASVHQR